MIDTHCHLTFPDFAGAIERTLDEAAQAGVDGVITVSTTPQDAQAALKIARAQPNVWCTAGAHPLYAGEAPFDWRALARVARDDRCVAWGEIGLDNHYAQPIKALQLRVLEEALSLIEAERASASAALDLPVVLHCREAFEELIAILRDTATPPSRFVFHCFTGDQSDMRRLLDFGAWVSFTGVVTYRNARDVQEAARLAPADRIMVETDAPFLSPEPHRKVRPNQPRFAMATARFLAELRGQEWDAFHAQINANVRAFYGVETA